MMKKKETSKAQPPFVRYNIVIGRIFDKTAYDLAIQNLVEEGIDLATAMQLMESRSPKEIATKLPHFDRKIAAALKRSGVRLYIERKPRI